MEVPLLDLNEQNAALEPQLIEAFERVLHSGRFILGEEVVSFEKDIAALVDAKFGIGVSSGTDAILLALMSLDIGPGDEVICPSFTFFSTAGCIHRTGAKPVFADSCSACFNVDPDSIESLINENTKAIMPVHLFGQSAEMDTIMGLANKHGLAVIEDAAQALGASYRNRMVGSIGSFGTFSFFPSKNLGGFGDSGMLVTNDENLADRARMLRSHGSKPKYYHKAVGGNFRIDPLQAALLAVKLPHYSAYTENRRANAAYYTEHLGKIDGVVTSNPCALCCGENSSGQQATAEGPCAILPTTCPGNGHIWNQYTLRILGEGKRDALRERLSAQGIGSEIYYPLPMHRQECFQNVVDKSISLPNCDSLAAQCVSIPVFPNLKETQLARVVDAISGFLAQS